MVFHHRVGVDPACILDPPVLWTCVLPWFIGTYTVVNSSSMWSVGKLGCLLLAVLPTHGFSS